ncbi:peptidylprolyl isomerase [Candidatus Woesearchaeota archaeon]|nr:peptidylprolyl isomerase [Candidatus Woesearchaeota archaeon]
MADVLKKGDFVELDYTGRLAEDGVVFDTTFEDVAKKNGLFQEGTKYGPVKICLGQRQVIEGLDEGLIGRDIGKTYKFRIPPEGAFGQKDARLIQLIATSKFTKQEIAPMPGLQVNIDGMLGTIRTVSGGRTLVDFNHPLSGKEIEYEATPKRVITETAEKLNAIMNILGIKMEYTLEGEKLTFKSDSQVLRQNEEAITKAVKEAIPEIKDVSFETKAVEGSQLQ